MVAFTTKARVTATIASKNTFDLIAPPPWGSASNKQMEAL
jgi:hypothetical protein